MGSMGLEAGPIRDRIQGGIYDPWPPTDAGADKGKLDEEGVDYKPEEGVPKADKEHQGRASTLTEARVWCEWSPSGGPGWVTRPPVPPVPTDLSDEDQDR